MLSAGYGSVCLVNSDSPTLPTSLLVDAARALSLPGNRIVLGPAEDGGYYLLGMKAAHAHLFADIAWSTDSVAATTRLRAAALGLEVVELPSAQDLERCVEAIHRSVTPEIERWIARGPEHAVTVDFTGGT